MRTTGTATGQSGAGPYIEEREAYVRRLLTQRYEASLAGDTKLVAKLDRAIADAEHTLAWFRRAS